jgi:hypothetical protein
MHLVNVQAFVVQKVNAVICSRVSVLMAAQRLVSYCKNVRTYCTVLLPLPCAVVLIWAERRWDADHSCQCHRGAGMWASLPRCHIPHIPPPPPSSSSRVTRCFSVHPHQLQLSVSSTKACQMAGPISKVTVAQGLVLVAPGL